MSRTSGSEFDSDSGFASATSEASSSDVRRPREHAPSSRLSKPARWTCDPAFGIIHQKGCATCGHYMSHVVEGSRGRDISFHIAVSERDEALKTRYLEGVGDGKQAQADKDRRKLSRYREERDAERKKRRAAEEDARRLRDELRELRDAFMAMQITYEEQISALTLGPSGVDELEMLRIMEIQSALFDESRKELSADMESEESSGSEGSTDTLVEGDDGDYEAASGGETRESGTGCWSSSVGGELNSAGASREEAGAPLSEQQARDLMAGLAQRPADTTALVQLRDLCQEAYRTRLSERTEAHKLVLKEAWKIPTILCVKPDVLLSGSTSTALPEIFVDASPKGIGFLWNNRWAAWTLHGWMSEGRNMPWAEMVAVELGIRTLVASGVRSTHIRVRSDNQAVVMALSRKSIRAPHDAVILKNILKMCQENEIVVMPIWVWTKHNPADALSRGEYPARNLYVDAVIGIPKHLEPFVKNVRAKQSA